jgi:hypothetical protein
MLCKTFSGQDALTIDRATFDQIIEFLRQRLSAPDIETVSKLLDKCVSEENRVEH